MRNLQLPICRRVCTLVSVAAVVLLLRTAASADDPFRRGDVNGDGSVDVSDGTRLLLSLFDRVEMSSCSDAADADDSGDLNLADAAFSFAFLFTGGAAPPAPGFLQCGGDPTPDELGCEEYVPCSLSESRDVGPEGGRLEYSSGVVLVIPPGAVSGETTITLSELPDGVEEVFTANPISGMTLLGGFSAGPDGLVFDVPITASVPVVPLTPGALPFSMGADLEAGIAWLAPTDITYFPEESRMNVTVRHFSNVYWGQVDGVAIATEVSDIPADDPCREKGIRVKTEAFDFESFARAGSEDETCQALSDNVEVQFLGCDGQPTERVVMSSIQGACDIEVDILGTTRAGIIDVDIPGQCRLELKAEVTIRSRLNAAQELGVDLPVFWSSSNPDVATIDRITGVLTVKGHGIADITARTADPRFRDVVNVITEIAFPEELEMAVDDELKLAGDCPGFRFESTTPAVAHVRPGTGTLVAESRGETLVQVFAGDAPQPIATVQVAVYPKVQGLWEFGDSITIEDEEGTTDCPSISGRLCFIQEGSQVEGHFESSGTCTVTPRGGGEPFEVELTDEGDLSGGLFRVGSEYGFLYRTVSEFTSEECENSGMISEDRPVQLSGPFVCTEVIDGETLVSEGSGEATLTNPEFTCGSRE